MNKEAPHIYISTINNRATHNRLHARTAMAMVIGLLEDLKAIGMIVDYTQNGDDLISFKVTEANYSNLMGEVIYDEHDVNILNANKDGEVIIANSLARLLEEKIVERRINDLYFEALYLGWRLTIDDVAVNIDGVRQTYKKLKVYMHDGENGTVTFDLTYQGVSEFEDFLFTSRLRRDVVFDMTTKVTSSDVHLTADGFFSHGKDYKLTPDDIEAAKGDQPVFLKRFMQTVAEKTSETLEKA